MSQRWEQLRVTLLSVVEEPRVAAVLRDHLGDRARTGLDAALGRLRRAEFTVAVIGRQGVGKSSLINALLGRRVAPVDETETTNVICTFRAAAASEERVVVTFEGGRQETRPLAEAELRAFTDEQQNPSNTLRVARVDAYLDAPLLCSGLILVDTPGVGSLTPTAERVTMEFLPRIALGLFVMGTAPTLLESEAIFLRATWAHSRSFVFVQNAWEGVEGEVEAARVNNLRKLTEISQREGGAAVALVVVDVHHAVEGLRNDKPELVAKSGLGSLVMAIEGHVHAGAERALLVADGAILADALRAAHAAVALRLASLDAADATSDEAFRKEAEQAEDAISQIDEKWRLARTLFEQSTDASLDEFDAQLAESVGAVKEAIALLVRDRGLAAEQISKALAQRLETATHGPQLALQRAFASHVEDVLDEAERLTKKLETVVGEAVGIPDAVKRVGGAEAVEKIGGVVAGVGGLAVTTVASMAVWAVGGALFAGQGLAAAIAAGAAAVPGVGWVIASGVLAVGFLLKKGAEQRAVASLLDAVHDATRETERRIRAGVRSAVRAQRDRVSQAISGQVRIGVQQQRELLERLRADRRASAESRALLLRELRGSAGEIARAEGRVSDLLAPLNRGDA